MKLKTDFITNSSSANFILYIESTANNLNEFIEQWTKYIEDFIQENQWRFDLKVKEIIKKLEDHEKKRIEYKEKIDKGLASEDEKTLYNLVYSHVHKSVDSIPEKELQRMTLGEMNYNQIVGSVYSVEQFIIMFNDILDDVPEWMIYLIVLSNMQVDLLSKYGFKNIRLKIEDD